MGRCLSDLDGDRITFTPGSVLVGAPEQEVLRKSQSSNFLCLEKPFLFIIDEAQPSCEDDDFWLSCVKEQAGDTPSPNIYLALFSFYGSASATVLQIPGSSPIQLKERQGWFHPSTWLATRTGSVL